MVTWSLDHSLWHSLCNRVGLPSEQDIGEFLIISVSSFKLVQLSSVDCVKAAPCPHHRCFVTIFTPETLLSSPHVDQGVVMAPSQHSWPEGSGDRKHMETKAREGGVCDTTL